MSFLKNYKHHFITLAIFLLILLCVPTSNGLTTQGVRVLALMAGSLYMWLTIGTGWTSLLALAGVAMIGAMSPSDVYAGSLGNSTIMIVISCVLLNSVLSQTGVIKYLASWFITRKGIKGKPYAFIALYLLGVTLIGTVMNVTTLCVAFIALTAGICEEIGYEKGSPFYTAMILGLFWMSNVTNGGSPISHSLPLLMIGTAAKAGVQISYSQYLAIGLPFIAIMYLMTILVICIIWRPEASKFKNYDVVAANEKRESLTKAGKFSLVVFIIVIIAWLVPDIFQKVLPTSIITTLKTLGVTIPTILGVAVLCMVHIDGKPVGDFRTMTKSVPVSLLIFCGAVIIFGNIFSSKDAGISTALNNVLSPVTSNMAPVVLCALVFLLCLIMTNFVSNTVAMFLFFAICLSALAGTNVSMVAVTIIISMVANFASLVPSAAVTAPLFFGDGYITVKNTFKWNLIMIGLTFIVTIGIIYPLGNAILK